MSAIRDSTQHEAEIPFLYRCMLCPVPFRIFFPLSGRYDRAHRSAALTMTLTKLPHADLRPSADFRDPFVLVISAHVKIYSGIFGLRRSQTCSGPSRIHVVHMMYDAFAYRSWNRTPPIDDRDRLSLPSRYGKRFPRHYRGTPWIRSTERGVDGGKHSKSQMDQITASFQLSSASLNLHFQ